MGGQHQGAPLRSYDVVTDFPCEAFQRSEDFEKLLLALETVRVQLVAIYGEDCLEQMDIVVYEINNH